MLIAEIKNHAIVPVKHIHNAIGLAKLSVQMGHLYLLPSYQLTHLTMTTKILILVKAQSTAIYGAMTFAALFCGTKTWYDLITPSAS